MPSTATITSFKTFVAGQRAKASEVNTNFDIFRGHLLPVSTDTQTSSDNTHDLGASDHRWRNIYLGKPPTVNGNLLDLMRIEVVTDQDTAPAWFDPVGNLNRIGFRTDTVSGILFNFRVPNYYVPGNQISLPIVYYGETIGNFVFQTNSYLYRPGTDYGDSTGSNVHQVASTISILTGTAEQLTTDSTLKVTDSSGRINGVTVTVGSLISVQLQRITSNAADVNSGTVFISDIMVDFLV